MVIASKISIPEYQLSSRLAVKVKSWQGVEFVKSEIGGDGGTHYPTIVAISGNHNTWQLRAAGMNSNPAVDRSCCIAANFTEGHCFEDVFLH